MSCELGIIIELPKISDPRGNLTVAERFKSTFITFINQR